MSPVGAPEQDRDAAPCLPAMKDDLPSGPPLGNQTGGPEPSARKGACPFGSPKYFSKDKGIERDRGRGRGRVNAHR